VTKDERAAKVVQLRQALARYRDARFATGECGGASGMMFFVVDGKKFYIGGMQSDHAEAVTTALNLTLDLLGPIDAM
jgi:hypothetical protein